MKKLVCYLFDRSDRGVPIASVLQGDPTIGAGISEWLEGEKLYLIAFRDRQRPAIGIGQHHELHHELEVLAATVTEPMQWKRYIKPGDAAERIFDSVGLFTDELDIDIDLEDDG